MYRDTNKEIVDMLKAAAPKCSFYLAITTGSSGYGNTNQHLDGIGILNHDTGIFSTQFLFAILGAGLYDGKMFELRTAKPVLTELGIGENLMGPGIHGLYRRVDKSWLPNPPQTAAQNPRLRGAMWALIEPALANTIPAVLPHE